MLSHQKVHQERPCPIQNEASVSQKFRLILDLASSHLPKARHPHLITHGPELAYLYCL